MNLIERGNQDNKLIEAMEGDDSYRKYVSDLVAQEKHNSFSDWRPIQDLSANDEEEEQLPAPKPEKRHQLITRITNSSKNFFFW